MDENPMGIPTPPAGGPPPAGGSVDVPMGGGQDQPTMPPPTPPAGGPGIPEPSNIPDTGTGGGMPPATPGM